VRPIPCRGCGRPIIFEKNESGRVVPLEKVATVYFIDQNGRLAKSPAPAGGYYISHFTTCPKASEFSRKLETDAKR
jgi:hypothetical protein